MHVTVDKRQTCTFPIPLPPLKVDIRSKDIDTLMRGVNPGRNDFTETSFRRHDVSIRSRSSYQPFATISNPFPLKMCDVSHRSVYFRLGQSISGNSRPQPGIRLLLAQEPKGGVPFPDEFLGW